jgi:hypothetical protein
LNCHPHRIRGSAAEKHQQLRRNCIQGSQYGGKGYPLALLLVAYLEAVLAAWKLKNSLVLILHRDQVWFSLAKRVLFNPNSINDGYFIIYQVLAVL